MILENTKNQLLPSTVTTNQARILERFSQELQACYEENRSIDADIITDALRVMGELAQNEAGVENLEGWRGYCSQGERKFGTTIIANSNEGDEIMLQLDGDGKASVGSYSHYLNDDEISLMLTFDLKSTNKGRLFRLLFEEKTIEIILGNDDAEGLPWTNQPDFGAVFEMDALAEDDYEEVTAAVDEEPEGSAVLTDDPLKPGWNEFTEKNNETIINPDHREENTMPGNTNLPPKPPPIRRLDSPGQQPPPRYRQPPPPSPSQGSNALALISLIAGIVGIAGMLVSICVGCVGIFSFLAGVAAAVMGYLSKKQIDQTGGRDADRKMANIGMILGIVSAVLSIITFVIGLLVVGFSAGLDWLL